MATQTKDHIKPTFSLSHFLTSKGFTQHHFSTKNGAGFSLLEVMVAVVIMGFGLLAIMHLFPVGLRASRISYNTSQATFYAQKKMEELRNTGWSSIANAGKSEISGTIFSQQVTVSVKVANLLKEVTVAVFWTDYGAERNVELVTYILYYKRTV